MKAENTSCAHPSSQWRYSLRTMLISILACSALLAMFVWAGLVVTLISALVVCLLLLVLATVLHRKRLAFLSGAGLLLFLIPFLLLWLAPASYEESSCLICGKCHTTKTFLGITWYEREEDSELSTWYQQSGLPEHTHQWTFLCSAERAWGGSITNYDSFGFHVRPLRRLRDVAGQVDEETFRELAAKYRQLATAYFTGPHDRQSWDHFLERCDALLSSQRPPIDP